ncbi:DCC1-like thiol-disulfide oxidoreductase family protein [Natrialbaceae archaeon A-CW3]
MSAFINYFADDTRSSPINLAVVRVLLGAYVLWRVVSLDWGFYQEWPRHFNPPIAFLHQDIFLALLGYQQWMVAALLVGFIVGYRTRWTGGLASLLLMHMLSVKSTLYLAGTVESLFVCAYIILMFALFHDTDDDVLSVDAIRQTGEQSLSELNAFLKSDPERTYRMTVLKWSLLAVGIIYVGSAWGKFLNGPIDIWLSGTELQRDILFSQEVTGIERPLAEPILANDFLSWAGFVGTALIQVSLLIAVVLGLPITLSALGLIGFHLGVIAMLGLYFIDMILVLSLFAAWDVVYRRLAASDDESVQVVYDERCYFCARSLYPFKHLDVNDSVQFYSQSDVPRELIDRDDVDLESELYLFRDGEAYGGYEAFRQLFAQFWVFLPLTLLMALPPVRVVGDRVYAYIARNRSRHFVCSIDAEQS